MVAMAAFVALDRVDTMISITSTRDGETMPTSSSSVGSWPLLLFVSCFRVADVGIALSDGGEDRCASADAW